MEEVCCRMQEGIGRILTRLAIAHSAVSENCFAEIGLHKGQAGVLFALWEVDGQSQVQLARALGITPPTVNGLIAKLERGGFVKARPCREDGRLKRIYLTEKGREIRVIAERQAMAIEGLLLEGFSEIEKHTAILILGKIADNLRLTRSESAESTTSAI